MTYDPSGLSGFLKDYLHAHYVLLPMHIFFFLLGYLIINLLLSLKGVAIFRHRQVKWLAGLLLIIFGDALMNSWNYYVMIPFLLVASFLMFRMIRVLEKPVVNE